MTDDSAAAGTLGGILGLLVFGLGLLLVIGGGSIDDLNFNFNLPIPPMVGLYKLMLIPIMIGVIGVPVALIYTARFSDHTPAAVNQPAASPAAPTAAYLKCPNCGSEELIEVENGRIMMPYEDAEHNYVAISEVNYATCAKCGAMIGTLPTDNTHPKAPVPGVKYQTCEVCGSSEFMMSIFTKIRMTAGKIEDLSETHGPILCLKCGHDLSQPLDDMAPALAVAVPHEYEAD